MTENMLNISKAAQPASFKLISLSAPIEPICLETGRAAEVFPGIFFTLGSPGGEALLEVHRGLEHGGTVLLNESAVVDIAEAHPGDTIQISGDTFVYLRPLQAFVPKRKIEAHFEKFDKLVQAYLGDDDKQEILKNLDNKDGAFNQRHTAMFIKHSRKVLVTLAIIGTIIIGFSVFKKEPAKAVQAQKASQILEQPHSTPLIDTKKEEDLPKIESDEKHAEPPTKIIAIQKPKAPAPVMKKTVAVPKQKAKFTAISPEALSKYKQSLQEYSLEANYDPDGAKRKLRALYNEVPKGTELSKIINETISRL